jgi:hypothetical protein
MIEGILIVLFVAIMVTGIVVTISDYTQKKSRAKRRHYCPQCRTSGEVKLTKDGGKTYITVVCMVCKGYGMSANKVAELEEFIREGRDAERWKSNFKRDYR